MARRVCAAALGHDTKSHTLSGTACRWGASFGETRMNGPDSMPLAPALPAKAPALYREAGPTCSWATSALAELAGLDVLEAEAHATRDGGDAVHVVHGGLQHLALQARGLLDGGWNQSRSPRVFAGWVHPFRPTKKDNN